MGTTLNSFDNMLASAINNGMWNQCFADTVGNTTIGTTANSLVTVARFPRTLTVPTVGAGLTGGVVTLCRLHGGLSGGVTYMAALDYTLGSLNLSTNVFSSGVAMPVKTDPGNRSSTVQTASMLPMLFVDSATGTGTPTITITYTNQSGTINQTAAMAFTNTTAVNSAFCITSQLSSGDTAIRAVTNMSRNNSSTGTVSVRGLLPLGFGFCEVGNTAAFMDPLAVSFPSFKIEQGETISFWRFGSSTTGDIFAHIAAVGEN